MRKWSGARWRHARRLTLLGGLALLTAACTTAEDDAADWFHVDWLANYTEKHQLLGEGKVAWLRNFRVKRLPVYTEVTAERFPVTVDCRPTSTRLTRSTLGVSTLPIGPGRL